MKLNLGEGNIPLAGYVGIDRKSGGEIYPLVYSDSSVSEVRASHVLEHFSHRQVKHVLKEWVRVLEPGGVLKIAVPDFAKIVQWYQERRMDEPLQGYLVGGQVDDNDYHKAIFDEQHLRGCLERAGLVDIKPWESEIEDNASWEVSLNLQGMKPQTENWPASAAYNKYSQYGEDGILEAIFNRIGTTNKYCVDVGAADGVLFSNVRQFLERGWSGLLIESNTDRFDSLAKNSQQFEGVQYFYEHVEAVGNHSLDELLNQARAPQEFDLLSIDIDGQDYYIWNSLLHFNPRVVVIEYDPEADPMFIPPLGGAGQAGWNATTYVAAARGYICVARTRTNLICIRRDVLDAAGLEIKTDESNESAVETEEELQPVKIVAVMTVPRLGFSATHDAVNQALLALNIKIQQVEGVFWGQCLSRGIQQALDEGAEAILTIDYDSVFGVEHIVNLCRLHADRDDYDVLVPVQIKRECDQVLFNGNHGIDKDITKIKAGHFGLTIFDAAVFSRLPKPWFWGQPNKQGEWGEGRTDDDMWFWEQCEKAGIKVGLANNVKIGHLELGITWPDARYRPIRQSVSAYRKDGQPKECFEAKAIENKSYPCMQPRLDTGEPITYHPNMETAQQCCYGSV